MGNSHAFLVGQSGNQIAVPQPTSTTDASAGIQRRKVARKSSSRKSRAAGWRGGSKASDESSLPRPPRASPASQGWLRQAMAKILTQAWGA